MSFTVGVYDLFAYTIPGIMYLFIVNETLKFLGFMHMDYSSVSTPTSFVLIILAAFILGHIMDYPAHTLISLGRKNAAAQAIEVLKKNFPYLNIGFQPQERSVLYAFLRLNHNEITQRIDTNKAISILFQNISLGFLLYSLFVSVSMAITGFSLGNLILLLGAVIFSFVARQRSVMFNLWFNNAIFEASLTYGTTTKDILKTSQLLQKSQNQVAKRDKRIQS